MQRLALEFRHLEAEVIPDRDHPPGAHVLDASCKPVRLEEVLVAKSSIDRREKVSILSVGTEKVDGPLHGGEAR